MLTFIGEHSSKIDAKGRVSLPVQLKRQLAKPDEELRFVLKKSTFKPCLELHPMDSWQLMMERLTKKLNPIFNKKHNAFLTQFSRGTSEVSLDGLSRILINKNLYDLAGFDKEIVFLGVGTVIELWDKQKYNSAECGLTQEEFEQVSDEIFDADFNLYE
ncbi:MAG: division/cell wall cluster transcriptional repressor MraZ [Bacteroidales bacterium]|jgi:MraZ protein|nr:division/cell wall cluster transcriptional repressor MraZ [Bacteroidales bacterium]